MKHVDLYTDGSCKCNPGPGGWCAILVYNGHEKLICGGESHTTNNRMELTAIIEGLRALKESCEVRLTSDSKYALDALQNGWAESWKSRGWKKADKSQALNPDLWQILLDEVKRHNIEYVWVKGHAGHPYNERCDEAAQKEADKYAKNV
ncbi:MAG: ribonuclease HI [Clostridia bacterium]|nr:ribonuclease HI [Clostridia bacterium]